MRNRSTWAISIAIAAVLSWPLLISAQSELSISGFVDASATLPVEDDVDLGFSFDCLEIDIEKGLADGVSLRADVDLVEGGADVEQAYMSFAIPGIENGPSITFGKFNAPIGYELLDAPDMWQYSHSLVFENALPTNLSGVSIAHTLPAGLDVVAYLANGWDVNAADDSLMIFGGRLGYSGIEGLSAGVSAIQDDANENLIIDLDGEITMVPNLTVGFEFNTGGKDDNDEAISGWLVMANYALPFMAVTLRQDSWGEASSTTISPSYGIAEDAGVLFEFRIDNDGTNTSNSAAIEFTFSF